MLTLLSGDQTETDDTVRNGDGARVTESVATELLDTLSEVVFRTDAEGRWTYLNHAWTTLTGFDVESSIGARFLEYVHPDELEHTVALFMGVVAGGADYCHHETRYRVRDGSYRRVQIRANVLRDPAGVVVGNTGTIVDLTRTRFGADALDDHAAIVELISAGAEPDELPLGVVVYDSQLRLRRGSPFVDRLVGRPQRVGDPIARLAEHLGPVEGQRRSLAGDWGLAAVAVQTGRSQLCDLEAVDGHGSARSLRASMIPFRRDDEELFALVLSDVSDLRRTGRQQAGLARLGRRALSARDVSALLAEGAELVVSTLGLDGCDVVQSTGGVGVVRAHACRCGPGPSCDCPTVGTSASLVDEVLGADDPVVEHGAARAATIVAARVGETPCPYGVLVGYSVEARPIAADEAHFVQSVAHVLAAAVERDLAERELRRLYEAAGRARRWLAATAEVTTGVVAAPDSGSAFALVAKIARAVTSAEVCAVALPDEAGRLVVSAADVSPDLGVDAEQLRATPVRLDRFDPARALRNGAALLSADADADDRVFATEGLPVCALMIVPLVAAGTTLASLVLANTAVAGSFADEDLDWAKAFASDAALAVELSRTQRDRARLAVLQDRGRIARDLHDLVIQRLFAIGLRVQAVAQRIDGASGAQLVMAADDLDRTIEEIRQTVFDRQPMTPEEG